MLFYRHCKTAPHVGWKRSITYCFGWIIDSMTGGISHKKYIRQKTRVIHEESIIANLLLYLQSWYITTHHFSPPAWCGFSLKTTKLKVKRILVILPCRMNEQTMVRVIGKVFSFVFICKRVRWDSAILKVFFCNCQQLIHFVRSSLQPLDAGQSRIFKSDPAATFPNKNENVCQMEKFHRSQMTAEKTIHQVMKSYGKSKNNSFLDESLMWKIPGTNFTAEKPSAHMGKKHIPVRDVDNSPACHQSIFSMEERIFWPIQVSLLIRIQHHYLRSGEKFVFYLAAA